MNATITRTETGSQLITALETVWTAIRERHPEVPEVVMITGSGKGSMSLKWGHFWDGAWANGRFIVTSDGVITRDRKPELFVSGERIGTGAANVVQTLLHEASHAVAAVRSIKDCSRQNRYHNKRFLAIAEELGLAYRHDGPDTTLGFSAVEITDEARDDYADVIEQLDDAIALTMELPSWVNLTGGVQVGGDGSTGRKPKDPNRKSTGLAKATCECGRIIRVARATLEVAPITCGDCDTDFAIDE